MLKGLSMQTGKMTRPSSAGGIRYAFDRPPEAGTGLEIAPGIYWLRMPLPFALDHINLWLLDDGDGFTIVDTGIARDEVKSAWRALLAGLMSNRPVKRIISTHFHPDHFGLAGWLSETLEAPLWMTRAEWLTGAMLYADEAGRAAEAQTALFRRHGLDDRRLGALAGRGNGYRRVISAPPASYRRMSDGDVLRIDGCDWSVIVGRGHAPEHACLYCAEKGVFISGDQVLPRISPNISLSPAEPGADPLGEYLESLDRLKILAQEVLVLPSHDLPFFGIRARIEALRRHHAERLDRLFDYCRTPRTAAQTLELLFPRELDTHQIMFAMGESLSHLVRLERESRLRRFDGGDGIIRFAAGAAEL
jgi:glyoxylase-like metal-dependent hydrolase (beta-lactamase superfamily II)